MSALSKVVDEVVEGATKVGKAVPPVASPRAVTGAERARAQSAIDDIVMGHNAKVQGKAPEPQANAGWEDYFDNSINPNQKPESGRFRQQVEDDPEGIMANIWGRRGAARAQGEEGIIRSVDAETRLNAGENEATVFADTGWYRGVDGKMKFHASETHIKVNTHKMYNKIRARHAENPYKEGQEFKMRVRLEDWFESENLYKAYPELKDTEVIVHFKYMGKNEQGNDVFGIYNKERAAVGQLAGATMPSKDVPAGRINIYNTINDTWGNDQGRSSALHEIEHLIQRIEGFSEGANATELRRMAEAAADVRIDRYLLDALEENRVYSGMPAKERRALIEEMVANFDDELDEAGMAYKYYDRAIDRAIAKEWSDLHAERMDLETAWSGFMGDAVLALRMNDQTYDEVAALLNEGRFSDLWKQAFAIYQNSGGEVDSRLVQLFDGMREREFRRLTAAQGRTTEDYVDMINSPVPGGKAGIITESRRPGESAATTDGPLFERGRNRTRGERGRGGIDGGSLDSGTSPDDAWKNRPEGTQQQGTLDELFPNEEPEVQSMMPPSAPKKKGPITPENFNENSYYQEQMAKWRENGEDLETAARMASRDVDELKDNMRITSRFSRGVNQVKIKGNLHGTKGDETIEFLMNPTETGLRRWAAKALSDDDGYKAVRVVTDVQGNLYVWDANKALHHDFIKSTGIKMNIEDDWTDVDGVEPDGFWQIFADDSPIKKDSGIDLVQTPDVDTMSADGRKLLELEARLDDLDFNGGDIADSLEVEDQIWDLIDRTNILEEEGWQQAGWLLETKDGWENLTLPDGSVLSRKL